MADELNTLVLNLSSGGDVVIRLRPDLAPGHVARIKELVEEGFYDGVVFHRVIPGFMAQGGDPTGTGMGGSDRPDLAPDHVARIRELAEEGFYNGVPFHRVIDGFMAQGGDPTGTGTGGSSKPNLKAEFSRAPHVRGTASMARTNDPNSANSQFFICFDDCGFLDGQYTVWGEVVEGMEHVDALPKGEPPRTPGKIVKASLRP